ncbi:peptide deformylase, mitochondrial-like [Onthophagus taurus]|uniref:peptide deformylase, mitochondrial-like n=1 Tax=Onthophagus taurus TaxID=166361 RepID=UPI000C201561|nr:peptide deformylase, mitochondrial-like [Onthophagus taurus]
MLISWKKFEILTKPYSRSIGYWAFRTWYAKLWKRKPGNPPYNHVVQIGDPRLRVKCSPIPVEDIKSNEIQYLIKHLKHVLKRYDCVGLSAPQIGVDLQVFVMELSKKQLKDFSESEIKSKDVKVFPLTVVINPSVKIVDFNKIVFSESCESVKGFCGDVPRYKSIELTGYNENGENLKMEANGWLARIIQHETDHLNGKIYTDIMSKDTLACSCWEAVNENRGKVVLPYSPD